jgi:hypothetical protein
MRPKFRDANPAVVTSFYNMRYFGGILLDALTYLFTDGKFIS